MLEIGQELKIMKQQRYKFTNTYIIPILSRREL